MAAATEERNTPEVDGTFTRVPMAANTKILKGTMVAIAAATGGARAPTAATDNVLGRAEETVDNTAGDVGDLEITIKRGVFGWVNSPGDSVDVIGSIVYALDNQTVSKTDAGGTLPVAGQAVAGDDDYIYIDHRVGRVTVEVAAP